MIKKNYLCSAGLPFAMYRMLSGWAGVVMTELAICCAVWVGLCVCPVDAGQVVTDLVGVGWGGAGWLSWVCAGSSG